MDQYQVKVFFFNPCITEKEEYEKRKANQVLFLEKFNCHYEDLDNFNQVEFLEGDYNPHSFFEAVKGLENCKEGGERCHVCYQQRLEETAKEAVDQGYNCFTTTLSVSPHKKFSVIEAIGQKLSEQYGVEFINLDFKKKAGYQESTRMSKEYGLYRQDYCGCIFSKLEREAQKAASAASSEA